MQSRKRLVSPKRFRPNGSQLLGGTVGTAGQPACLPRPALTAACTDKSLSFPDSYLASSDFNRIQALP